MKRSRFWAAFTMAWSVVACAAAQTPQPFPKPGDPARPQPSAPKPTTPPAAGPTSQPPQPTAAPVQAAAGEPTEQTLGLPVYPGAQYITSYDAGRGQRYFLFGTAATFPEIVAYYRTMLKQRGSLVFELPAVHMFEVGRFRDETMAFPPGVTVKDYTWNGSEGYLNPRPGGQPSHYKTIIQLVPAPAGAPAR
jgi:hypothetical protein